MKFFNPGMVLARLALLNFILAHYNGCYWWGVWEKVSGDSTIWPSKTMNPGFGPGTYLEDEDFYVQYFTSLYWGLSALSGLGSGLSPGPRHLEIFHCIMISYLGTFFVAYIVGEVKS